MQCVLSCVQSPLWSWGGLLNDVLLTVDIDIPAYLRSRKADRDSLDKVEAFDPLVGCRVKGIAQQHDRAFGEAWTDLLTGRNNVLPFKLTEELSEDMRIMLRISLVRELKSLDVSGADNGSDAIDPDGAAAAAAIAPVPLAADAGNVPAPGNASQGDIGSGGNADGRSACSQGRNRSCQWQ